MTPRRWSAKRIAAVVLIVVAAEVIIYRGALAGTAWLEGAGRGDLAAAAAYATPAVLIAQVAVPIAVYRLVRPRDDERGRRPDEPPPRLPGALDR